MTTITRFCSYDSINGQGNNPFYRDRGTKVHELCADYDFTDEFPIGTGVDGYLKAYADFKRDYRIKDWLFVEHMMGCAPIGFAGTLDRVGYIDGKLSILDIKTASKVNVLALTAQLTGYYNLYADDLKNELPELYGLQLHKNGTYRLIAIEPDGYLWESCKYIHQKGLKK